MCSSDLGGEERKEEGRERGREGGKTIQIGKTGSHPKTHMLLVWSDT